MLKQKPITKKSKARRANKFRNDGTGDSEAAPRLLQSGWNNVYIITIKLAKINE